MSTNATVSIVHENGTVSSSYLHFDGDKALDILKANYATKELAEKLVALGNMSFLDESCDGAAGHSFLNPVEGQTVFYGRDRGESGNEPVLSSNLEQACFYAASYHYVFKNGWNSK